MKISLLKSVLSYFLLLSVASLALAKEVTPPQKTVADVNKVTIQNAWARPTNKGQEVGAAYMTLISNQDVSLVKAESDVTKSVEIHSMTMKKGVMKMRMLETLPLAAGKPYKLEPGGFHLMLFDLKKPLIEGNMVNFELTFKNKNGIEFKQQVKAAVKTAMDEAAKDGSHEHSGHQHHH